MAQEPPNELQEADTDEIDAIKKQFLAGVALKSFCWKFDEDHTWKSKDVSWQSDVLKATVLNPLVKKYPPRHSYQKAFVKFLLQKLEKENVEISECLYTTYADLISSRDADCVESGYRIYSVFVNVDIILRESNSFVTKGSTGLVTWQAAKVLVEWCSINMDLISGRSILELGCGLGFTGLVVSKCFNPKNYMFSDYHPKVLEELQCNLTLNLHKLDSSSCSSGDFPQSTLGNYVWKNIPISVIRLDWNDVNHGLLTKLCPDIILAADVIYDVKQISGLVQLLDFLLTLERPASECVERMVSGAVAYIACTIRNEETITAFLKELGKQHAIISLHLSCVWYA